VVVQEIKVLIHHPGASRAHRPSNWQYSKDRGRMALMVSRRDFISAALFAGAVPVRMPQNPTIDEDESELALVNGRIYTFDATNRVVDSVLMRNGRFAALGQGAQTARRVIDLQGRTVIPGLIDNHTHFVRIGNLPGHDVRALEFAFSVAAVQKVIATRAATIPAGEFITALAGLARRQFAEKRFPTMAELDAAAPRHPVVISELVLGQTNTLGRDALRKLGVAVEDDGSVANQNRQNSTSLINGIRAKA
jgi:predicted amidohydrolase YtcJ